MLEVRMVASLKQFAIVASPTAIDKLTISIDVTLRIFAELGLGQLTGQLEPSNPIRAGKDVGLT